MLHAEDGSRFNGFRLRLLPHQPDHDCATTKPLKRLRRQSVLRATGLKTGVT